MTFVRFFLSPLKDVGASLSTFIRELLIDLPVTLYPVALILVTVFLFLILFMTFGYSFKLPFFLSIEPSPYHGVTGGVSNQQTIEDNTKRLMEQVYMFLFPVIFVIKSVPLMQEGGQVKYVFIYQKFQKP